MFVDFNFDVEKEHDSKTFIDENGKSWGKWSYFSVYNVLSKEGPKMEIHFAPTGDDDWCLCESGIKINFDQFMMSILGALHRDRYSKADALKMVSAQLKVKAIELDALANITSNENRN